MQKQFDVADAEFGAAVARSRVIRIESEYSVMKWSQKNINNTLDDY